MNLINRIKKFGNKCAVVLENNDEINYLELYQSSKKISQSIFPNKLIFLLAGNNIETISGYIGFLNSNSVTMFINEDIKDIPLKKLINKYQPDYIFCRKKKFNFSDYLKKINFLDYELFFFKRKKKIKIDKKLSLLMPTSGSTGSPKFVKISKDNILYNTKSILDFLKIKKNDITITTLPISYVYGLSIINTHLFVGAKIILNKNSIISNNFWKLFTKNKVTNFNGVPYTYEILNKLQIEKLNFKFVKFFTQAGGKLSDELTKKFLNNCKKNNKKFITMYGSAEATARMSYVPWEKALKKVGSIGIPVKGGNFKIKMSNKGNENVGELIYSGKNVSMGYCNSKKDLKKPDTNKGILKTGDLVRKDKDNYYYIVGRKDRFVKIYGNRINLFEIEEILMRSGFKVICQNNDINLITIKGILNSNKIMEIKNILKKNINLNLNVFKFVKLKKLPLSQKNKLKYND